MKLVVERQTLWLEAIQRRISATGTMLGSMKRVKMCGLADTLFANVHELRKQELKISDRFRKLLIYSMLFAYTTPVLAPVLTFTTYALLAMRSDGSQTLTTTKVFTSLSIFALITEPLASLIMAMVTFGGSLGCFDRIQVFLSEIEHSDPRRMIATKEDSVNGSQASSTQTGSTGSTTWTEKSISTADETVLPFTKAGSGGDDAVLVEDGSFGYAADADALVSAIETRIPRGKLTMIVGPVGCGKTTLIKSLLGEVPALQGCIKSLGSNVAYCEQTPFHMNGTVRESITAFAEVDERWYASVVKACALTEDLRQMQLGDSTRIGSKGVALSGGQSQRVALARAAYARHDICMLDDVLSGLDTDTEHHVFHNLLGKDGLFRRLATTVVVASSSNKRLPYADHIIVLNDKGRIAEQGSFAQLNANGGFVADLNLPPADWRVRTQPTTALDTLLSSGSVDVLPLAPAMKEVVEDPDEQFEANKRTGVSRFLSNMLCGPLHFTRRGLADPSTQFRTYRFTNTMHHRWDGSQS